MRHLRLISLCLGVLLAIAALGGAPTQAGDSARTDTATGTTKPTTEAKGAPEVLGTQAVRAAGTTKVAKPCGKGTLWATHAASADFWDANGDRLECYAGSPYVDGRDNRRPLPLNTGYKLYSYGDLFGRPTGVTSVDATANTFVAVTEGQEDDSDWNGCSGVCTQTFAYDANDLFFVDSGHGSTQVSLEAFEATLPGTTEFSFIYVPGDPSAVNIFSLAN